MHAEPNAPPELPDDEEPAVAPGDDSNDDPTPPLPVDPSGTPQRNPAVDQVAHQAVNQAANEDDHVGSLPELPSEEPELGNERDIPSDGRDLEGEGMIRDLHKSLPPLLADKPERE